jgi:hypothetical protein
MQEESTRRDPVVLWQQASEAAERGEFDAVMDVYAADAVWDASLPGVGIFDGVAAIRRFLEDWIGDYVEYAYGQELGLHLGNGVVFVVGRVDGRPVGGKGWVHERWAFTSLWRAAKIVRVTVDNDIDAARAAAERLAQRQE